MAIAPTHRFQPRLLSNRASASDQQSSPSARTCSPRAVIGPRGNQGSRPPRTTTLIWDGPREARLDTGYRRKCWRTATAALRRMNEGEVSINDQGELDP